MKVKDMDYEKYYEARKIVTTVLKEDLLGPVTDNEILCDEMPLNHYILGKLYPQGFGISDTEKSASEDVGELDDESGVTLSYSNNPSSFGISFSLKASAESFTIIASAAKYVPISKEEAEQKGKRFSEYTKKNIKCWERTPLPEKRIVVNTDTLICGKTRAIDYEEGLSLRVLLHKVYDDNTKTITVSLLNNNKSYSKDYALDNENSFFQPQIVITSETNAPIFTDVRRNTHLSSNEEVVEMELLYSKVRSYASGHGCAVNWTIDEDGDAIALNTDFFPNYEVLQMMPSKEFSGRILGMKYLATGSQKEIISELRSLTNAYGAWIKDTKDDIQKLDAEYQEAAIKNVLKCENTKATIEKSIAALEDITIFRAFQLANEAMLMQRIQTKGKKTNPEEIRWYPFQLAFFLQEIISFADPTGEERKNVDLLWFPTGGGKTEAYLGIAAFVIFLRRLLYGSEGAGVTVLMRYTLRLLSFQQFERASSLICACELIRRREQIAGGEIGIGLWAGMSLTPNRISVAKKILAGEDVEDYENSNPVQIEKCPYCGAAITAENYVCDEEKKRMRIHCSNEKCAFHSGLPIYLIDEEIYEHTPSFIVATIDKFAQVALNYDTSSIFGKKKNQIPPNLIIQDELHLISGPLGTITGLYEAAFRKLCENKGIYPKIIASTATIRNAKEQINALYASPYTQFPQQGIDINDSFFAVLSSKDDKPARLYLGCMGIGTSPTTMMIRVMAGLLFGTRYLTQLGYPDKVVDSFWTITGYFNTLRELGGAIVRVVDDIQDRFDYLRSSKFAEKYPLVNGQKRYDKYKELTSREKSENIGSIIQNELTEPYTSDSSTNPYDFLLSSNMISVGVDVGRLGSMVVVGQPKTTSEYIQATSRVGRETPGLVVTTYNQSKSRDRSHYEDFRQYHESFYRYVEATSITPFSDRARDRALQALYVILCRNLIESLSEDSFAVNFSRNMPQLGEVRDYILEYVKRVDPSEYEHVMYDLEEIENEWEEKSSRRDKLYYRGNKYIDPDNILFDPDYYEDSRFRVLNTMRSVETTVTVTTYE